MVASVYEVFFKCVCCVYGWYSTVCGGASLGELGSVKRCRRGAGRRLLRVIYGLRGGIRNLSSRLSSLGGKQFHRQCDAQVLSTLPSVLAIFSRGTGVIRLTSSPAAGRIRNAASSDVVGSGMGSVIPRRTCRDIHRGVSGIVRANGDSATRRSLVLSKMLRRCRGHVFPLSSRCLLYVYHSISRRARVTGVGRARQDRVMHLGSLVGSVLGGVPICLFIGSAKGSFHCLC